MNDVYTTADGQRSTCLVALDLSAAFDTLDHATIIDRLRHTFGIESSAIDWLTSYLTNRSQFVNYGNVLSPPTHCSIGVPQGSVLGRSCSHSSYLRWQVSSSTSASHFINLRTTHNFISASTQNPLSNHWTSWTNAVVRSSTGSQTVAWCSTHRSPKDETFKVQWQRALSALNGRRSSQFSNVILKHIHHQNSFSATGDSYNLVD